jgi:hypothetical protein
MDLNQANGRLGQSLRYLVDEHVGPSRERV